MLHSLAMPETIDTDSMLARAAKVIPGGASAGGRRVFRDIIIGTEGAYLWNARGARYDGPCARDLSGKRRQRTSRGPRHFGRRCLSATY